MSKSLSVACAVLCALAALLATPERVCSAEWGELSPAGKRITQALSEATALEFIETPLQDVIDYLKDRHGIEIQLDCRALDDVGVPSDTPITKALRGVSLRSGLRLMLADLDLTRELRLYAVQGRQRTPAAALLLTQFRAADWSRYEPAPAEAAATA